MSRTRLKINPDDPRSLPKGRVNHAVLDGTTERDLQQQHDDAEAPCSKQHDGEAMRDIEVCAAGTQAAPHANRIRAAYRRAA